MRGSALRCGCSEPASQSRSHCRFAATDRRAHHVLAFDEPTSPGCSSTIFHSTCTNVEDLSSTCAARRLASPSLASVTTVAWRFQPASSKRILPDLKNGKPLAVMPEPQKDSAVAARPQVPQTLATGKAVTMTIDELRQRLEERARRYANLFVDYDTVTEALAQPMDLASWDMNILRDHTTRVREGFAGEKRYHQVTLPTINVLGCPLDKVQPANNAPPDIAQRMQDRRQRAAASKEKGNLAHLFGLNDHLTQKQTRIFDGNECFRLLGDIKLPLPPDQFSMESCTWRASDCVRLILSRLLRGRAFSNNTGSRRISTCTRSAAFFRTKRSSTEHRASWSRPNGNACQRTDVEIQMIDRIWFDPAVGFAPRKWNQRVNGSLESVRANSDFEEMAPGCWLPWEGTWTIFPPVWASQEHRDLPAYRYQHPTEKGACKPRQCGDRLARNENASPINCTS